MNKGLTIALAVILVLGGGGALLAKPADAATPGEALYTLDLVAESVQRVLTLDPVAKAELEQEILDERAEELTTVAEVEGVSDANLSKAIDAVDAQSDRVQKRIADLESKGNVEEGALEQVKNRYAKQVQTHTESMNQVKSSVKNMGEDTQIKLQTTLDNMESGNGSGSDTSNGNSTDSGSSGSGNTDSGSGSSGSSGGNGKN